MKKDSEVMTSSRIYYRLIALWVVCEAVLGGIIHGLKLPVSGLIVGSSAVICISLIAYFFPKKGAILKATLIVAIFKMMLSPHSPLPAYFAVFFQGLMGELLFFNKQYYRVSAIIFAIVSLLESALQRILVMTLIYGSEIWKAVDSFINGFTKGSTNYSFWLIGSYLFFHLLIGVLVGWFISTLPQKLKTWSVTAEQFRLKEEELISSNINRKKKGQRVLLIVWIILVLLFIQSSLHIGKPLLPQHTSLQILIRSLIIVFTWYFIAGPLLTRFLRSWLMRKQQDSKLAIEEISALLPSTKYIVRKSWDLSSSQKGWRRFPQFCKLVLVNTLYHA